MTLPVPPGDLFVSALELVVAVVVSELAQEAVQRHHHTDDQDDGGHQQIQIARRDVGFRDSPVPASRRVVWKCMEIFQLRDEGHQREGDDTDQADDGDYGPGDDGAVRVIALAVVAHDCSYRLGVL